MNEIYFYIYISDQSYSHIHSEKEGDFSLKCDKKKTQWSTNTCSYFLSYHKKKMPQYNSLIHITFQSRQSVRETLEKDNFFFSEVVGSIYCLLNLFYSIFCFCFLNVFVFGCCHNEVFSRAVAIYFWMLCDIAYEFHDGHSTFAYKNK